jgi:hypothetical protein
VQPAQQGYKVAVLFVAVSGHYYKFMRDNAVGIPVWYRNAGNLKNNFEHLLSSKPKWTSVAGLQ